MMEIYSVLIIGAGPSGLKLGRELKRKNKKYLILEKESQVAMTWEKMPETTKLISPWALSCLDKEDERLHPLNSYLSCRDYLSYLREYSARHQLNISTGIEVTAIKKSGDVFVLQTKNGEFRGYNLVNATGYFNFPVYPSWYQQGRVIPEFHFSQYSLQCLKGKKRVLIVGKRQSAGQVIQDLIEHHEISLSVRGPIRFSPSNKILTKFYYYYYLVEKFLSKIFPHLPFPVYMNSEIRPLIDNKKLNVVGDISELIGDEVVFKDHSRLQIDAIIYATGFSYETSHLNGVSEQEVFFLGRENFPSFRSRFIRGIRDDVESLLKKI